jgi:hypothetical protein
MNKLTKSETRGILIECYMYMDNAFKNSSVDDAKVIKRVERIKEELNKVIKILE